MSSLLDGFAIVVLIVMLVLFGLVLIDTLALIYEHFRGPLR